MNDCEKYQELISRMLDEDLSRAERDDLAEHVRRCPDCAAVYVAFRSLSESVGGELDEVPHELHEKIMSDARRENLRLKNKSATANRRWHYVLTAAACLVLVVAAGLSLPKLLSRSADQAAVEDAEMARSARASARRNAEEPAAAPALGMARPEAAEAEEVPAEEAAPAYPDEDVFVFSDEKAVNTAGNEAGLSAAANDAPPRDAAQPAPLPAPTPPAGAASQQMEPAAEADVGLPAEEEELIVLSEEQSEWLLERITKRGTEVKTRPDRELHLLLTVDGRQHRATILFCGEAVYYVYAEGDVYFTVHAKAEEVLEEFGLDK